MIRVAILTVSDSAFNGARADQSGPALAKRCRELQWPVVETALLPDDEAAISRQIASWADGDVAALILTTGGTGIGLRDTTPEATAKVLERQLPGVSELMRAKGLQQTPYSVLSRGLAGARKRAFVLNLPGSPAGAVQSLDAIQHLIPHIVDLLLGNTQH